MLCRFGYSDVVKWSGTATSLSITLKHNQIVGGEKDRKARTKASSGGADADDVSGSADLADGSGCRRDGNEGNEEEELVAFSMYSSHSRTLPAAAFLPE